MFMLWFAIKIYFRKFLIRNHIKTVECKYNLSIFKYNLSQKTVCQWPGRLGFNPKSSHTKDSKIGT